MIQPPKAPGLPSPWRLALAAAGGTCIANAAWWMQPLLMHDLSQMRQLGDFASGMVLTFEMTGLALSSALATRLLVGLSLMRVSLLGLVLAVAGNVLSLVSDSYGVLLGARLAAGLGAGLGLMMMNTVAAQFADVDRAFARLAVVNILFGILITAAAPALQNVPGFASPFTVVLAAMLATIPAVALLPKELRVSADAGHAQGTLAAGSSLRIGLLAAITFLIGCASGMMWVFYALIGQKAGLDMIAIDGAISFAIFGALVAAGLASLLGGRIGRVVPVVGGLAVLAVSVAILANDPDALAFRLSTMGNIAALYFITPYLFGAAAHHDSSGRGAVYVGSAFYLTGAVGPAFGGLLSATVGMGIVGIATIAVAVLSALGIWWIEATATAGLGNAADQEGSILA